MQGYYSIKNEGVYMENRDITLCLTEACNLNCTYCYENHKSKRKMTFEQAKKIIDFEMHYKDKFDGVTFELFGGEPFLCFDLIKEIVDYLEKEYKTGFFCSLTTNGTLVHGEIQQWLLKHKETVGCGLSLDGPRELHNINRDNSFDKIDLDFFVKTYPYQLIKMTISQETLPQLLDCVLFAHKKGFKVACNLAYGIDWSNKENVDILEQQLVKLINFYIENPDIEPCTMLGERIFKVAQQKDVASRECGAGLSMRAYAIDGIAYPCQFFMPVSIGKEKAIESLKIKFHEDIIPDELLDKRCKDCVIKSSCHICYGSNYASTGNIYLHEENWCILNKIIFKARAYFKLKQFEHGQLTGSEIEKKATLQSALMILEGLK